MIVITDPAKEVSALGAFPLPVEVVPFGWQATKALIEEILASLDVLGRETTLRMNGAMAYRTDEGNYILDLALGRIGDARQLSLVLNQVPGVVENGLFVDIADQVVIGQPDGSCELRDLSDGARRSAARRSSWPDPNIFDDL